VNPLLDEVQAMQNAALGAALIWRFTCGYCPQDDATQGTPIPLTFLVLPVVLHARTCESVLSTQPGSGLRAFEAKFSEAGDLLLAVHDRMLAMRGLSLKSNGVALATGLVTLVTKDGSLWPRSYARPRRTADSVEALLRAAERFGGWCRPLSLFEISGILRVEI
jgi:hypothetical protein